jgi:glycosyltransferase involved in cell wall biosynthesis
LVLGELVDRLVAHGLEVHTIGSAHGASTDVVNHGEYESHELDDLLREIDPDIAILPSVVPETFSLMLTELWQARIPVVALDAGAVASRVRENGGGFLVSNGTAGDFADAALKVMASPDDLATSRLRLTLADTRREAPDVIGEHLRLYQGLVELRG